MNSEVIEFSPRMRKAATAELRRMSTRRVRLAERVDTARAQYEALRNELAALDEQIDGVTVLAGREAPERAPLTMHVSSRQDAGAKHLLNGRRVREEAVRVLLSRGRTCAHYRDWYDLLYLSGFRVLGKDPLAVFLTQLTRSPVVVASTQPGVYEVDVDSEHRITRDLERCRIRLQGLVEAIRENGLPDSQQVAERADLLEAAQRLERELAEAHDVLSASTEGDA